MCLGWHDALDLSAAADSIQALLDDPANVALIRDGEFLYTFIYIAASLLIVLVGAYLGILIVKSY